LWNDYKLNGTVLRKNIMNAIRITESAAAKTLIAYKLFEFRGCGNQPPKLTNCTFKARITVTSLPIEWQDNNRIFNCFTNAKKPQTWKPGDGEGSEGSELHVLITCVF